MTKSHIFKRITIISGILAGLIVTILFATIAMSPYGKKSGHDYKLIKESIVIKAPVEKVFQYLGDSDNASDWSVFVDHISPINNTEVKDGQQGSIRRCFVHENEQGETWDEETLVVELNKRRRLNCYNFQNFSMEAANLLTEQLYEPLENGECKLSFTLFFDPGKAPFIDNLKMYYAAFTIADIFQKNLDNIKKFNEL